MTLLSRDLLTIGSTIPLPEADELRTLFRDELLVAGLQRRLLEALAASAPVPETLAAESGPLLRLAAPLKLERVEQLESWCRQHAIPLADLQALASFPERLQAASEAIWADAVPGRFLERRASLDQVTLSVLRFEDADLALELYFQMVDGDVSYSMLIDRYGSQPGQPPRAMVGPVSLAQLHPLLARASERYAPGALIPPLEINGLVHLLRVEVLSKASLDEPMRQRMLIELRQQWLDEQLQLALDRLNAPTRPSPAIADV